MAAPVVDIAANRLRPLGRKRFGREICADATYILESKFDKDEIIGLIEREGMTHTMMVPAQVITVLDHPGYDPVRLSSLQAPLPQNRKQQLASELPGRLFELYGLTEGFLTTLRPEYVLEKPGSVGPPMIFNEFKIVDDSMQEVPIGETGEILGRGPTMMSGYLNKPEQTQEALVDGKWIKTGDIGFTDAEGYIYLVDRKKDMITSFYL